MNRKEAGMREEGGFPAGKELAYGPQDADPKNRQGQEAGPSGLGSLRVYLQSFLKSKGRHCVCCAEQ